MRWSLVSLALLLGGCAPAKGAEIRVATATAAELEAARDKDNVWYEFQAGDVIPVQLGFLGAVEGGADAPVAFRAKQRFYFVMSKNMPMQISFDGESFAGPYSSQSVIAVVPRQDGKGGQLGWLIYMGESGEPEKELEKILTENRLAREKAPTEEAPAEEAPAETTP